MRGLDIDGNEIEIEADELMGRMFQHEIDHLNGVLMFDRMTPEQRKEAMTEYRKLQEAAAARRAASSPAAALSHRAARVLRHAGHGGAAAARAGRCRSRRARSWSPAIDKRRGRGSELSPTR